VSDAEAPLEGRIGLDVIIRLIKLQSLCTQTNTLFPSLKRLRIDNAKSAMDYLDLFVTPSLEAIEITGVSEDHFDTFYSFFTTIADEAPGLSSLILGPGPMPSIVMGMSLTFRHLQRLEFMNISTSFNFDFLENIGRLESLQSLTVDMGDSDSGLYVSRASELERMRVEQMRMEEEARQKKREEAAALQKKKREEEIAKAIQEARIKELEDQLRRVREAEASSALSGFAGGESQKGCEGDTHSRASFSSSKANLHVPPPELDTATAIASLNLNLFGSDAAVGSTIGSWGFGNSAEPTTICAKKKKKKSAAASTTPARSSCGPALCDNVDGVQWGRGDWGISSFGEEPNKMGYDTPPPPTCGPPPSACEIPPPACEVARDIPGPPKSPEQPEVRSPSPSVWSRASSPVLPCSDITTLPDADDTFASSGGPFCALKTLLVRGSQSLVEELVSIISSRTLQSMSVTFSTDAPASPLPRSTKEVAANISSIAQIRWRNTLSKLSIGISASESVVWRTSHLGPLPSTSLTLKNLFCLSKLEHLDLSNMPSLSIESGFDYLSRGSTTKLKTLFLPDDATAPGISLSRLRVLAEACPDLLSLRCKLKHLSNIPAPRDLPPIPFSHTLETLLIGNADAHPDPQRVLDIARYLDFLFPHLKTIETISGQNEAQWMSILSVVKVCQAVRLDERERLGAGIH